MSFSNDSTPLLNGSSGIMDLDQLLVNENWRDRSYIEMSEIQLKCSEKPSGEWEFLNVETG